MIICVAVICTKKEISCALISPDKSPVDMLDHDVVRRTSVPVSKFRTTTIALLTLPGSVASFYCEGNILNANFQHRKCLFAADSFVLCSKGHAVEKKGRLPSLEDGDEELLEG